MRTCQFSSPKFLCNLSGYLVLLAATVATQAATPAASAFRGNAALAYTRHATAFGERPSGSQANAQTRDWIVSQLKPLGSRVSLDELQGQTPAGPVSMTNIIATFPGTSGKSIVVSGHYDTKKIPMVHFVGANDAGSSTGFLIEFAHVAASMKHNDDIVVVFFDGEEALGEWTATDSVYGSRQLVAKWSSDGTLARIKALINVDMIGDRNLDLSNDANSSESLRATLQKIAEKLGYSQFLRQQPGAIDDDHKPFADSGVNVIDIIDLDYGPNGSYWHTAEDTVDKLSGHSLQVVGDLVVELVKELASS
jgi:glutaminyl-peptide cyclotransferase